MKKLILIYGVILGLSQFLPIYLIFSNTIGINLAMWLSILAIVIILVIPIISFKNSQGGIAAFQDILKISIGIGIIGLLLSPLLIKAYEFTLTEDQKQKMITEQLDRNMERFVDLESTADFDRLEEDMITRAEGLFDFTDNIIESFSLIFFVLIIAVVLGLVLRKEPL